MKRESTPDKLPDPLVAAAHALAEAQRQVAAATAAPSSALLALAECEKRCKVLQAELAELRDDRLRDQTRDAAEAERLTVEVNELRGEKAREREANVMGGLKELQRDRATFNTEKQAAQDKLKSDQLKLATDRRRSSALRGQITYHGHPADEDGAPAAAPAVSSSSGAPPPKRGRTDGTAPAASSSSAAPPPKRRRTDGTGAQPLEPQQGPPAPHQRRIVKRRPLDSDSSDSPPQRRMKKRILDSDPSLAELNRCACFGITHAGDEDSEELHVRPIVRVLGWLKHGCQFFLLSSCHPPTRHAVFDFDLVLSASFNLLVLSAVLKHSADQVLAKLHTSIPQNPAYDMAANEVTPQPGFPDTIERTITSVRLHDSRDLCGTISLMAARFHAWTKPIAFHLGRRHENDNGWTQRINDLLLPNAHFTRVVALNLRDPLSDAELSHIQRLLEASKHVKHLAMGWNLWVHFPLECGSLHLESIYLIWDGAYDVSLPSSKNLQHPAALRDLTGFLYLPATAHSVNLAAVLVDIPEDYVNEEDEDESVEEDREVYPG
ncbi:hypothetical protein C8R44DRAFT_744138 [Mycena epipterygia]|nr:hypothetical protein C8R44DRAFT_744138 [Mycena epipterygia]